MAEMGYKPEDSDWIDKLVMTTPLANTHDHTYSEAVRVESRLDFTILFDNYASGVFVRMGMTWEELARIREQSLGAREKWEIVAPYWRQARLTGVLRAQVHTIRDIFGYDDLSRSTVVPISEEIRRTNRPGRSYTILKGTANLHHCQIQSIQGSLFPVDRADEMPGFALFDILVNGLIQGCDIAVLEHYGGKSINSLDNYVDEVDSYLASVSSRAVALKSYNAYFRALDYRGVDKADAERAFDRLNKDRPTQEYRTPEETRPFEDYMFQHLAELAADYDLPFRVHVGFTQSMLRYSHATDFEPAIAANPRTRFILLHAGYPFMDETIALCMAHANLYADLGWIWQIDPLASEAFIRQFVTSVGPQQLLVFGGDTMYAEVTYGYSRPARLGLARAISSVLQDGLIDEKDVEPLVRDLCFENARTCFRLEGKFGL